MSILADKLSALIDQQQPVTQYGQVSKVLGLMVEASGLGGQVGVGSQCSIQPDDEKAVMCEVVGFRDNQALLLPFGTLEGVSPGCKVKIHKKKGVVQPDEQWLGRVINGLGEPIDGKGPISPGDSLVPLRNMPPPAHERERLGPKLDLGVRSVNTFTSLCEGQRIGIFSGSGVGKSVLLSMLARYAKTDVAVIGLIGERGREVQEFLQDDLGEEGLKRSVVIVSTSDESALMRRQAAYMTLAVSEYFRDQGKQVLCMMDSVTRFAMAQREIGLSVGEPPTTKGYPPTTFGELARLLERAGPGTKEQGAITGIFTVLVEGDDHNEPVADAVRGIVDGHIVMERAIADRGRYPAVNILKSLSRSMPDCLTKQQEKIVRKTKDLMSSYEDMADMIRLGAYRKGTDPKVDEAVRVYDDVEAFLTQDKDDKTSLEDGYNALEELLRFHGVQGLGVNDEEGQLEDGTA